MNIEVTGCKIIRRQGYWLPAAKNGWACTFIFSNQGIRQITSIQQNGPSLPDGYRIAAQTLPEQPAALNSLLY